MSIPSPTAASLHLLLLLLLPSRIERIAIRIWDLGESNVKGGIMFAILLMPTMDGWIAAKSISIDNRSLPVSLLAGWQEQESTTPTARAAAA